MQAKPIPMLPSAIIVRLPSPMPLITFAYSSLGVELCGTVRIPTAINSDPSPINDNQPGVIRERPDLPPNSLRAYPYER